MGILDDVKRLGIELNDDDKKEIEAMKARAKAEKKDRIVQETLLEYFIGEYLTVMRPEIMSQLEAEKTKENKELIRELTRLYNDAGERICDEVGCSSVENVGKCDFCERSVCSTHNFSGKGGHCCYACHLERGGEPIHRES